MAAPSPPPLAPPDASPTTQSAPSCAHERECPGSDLCLDGHCAPDPGPAPALAAPAPALAALECEPWSDDDVTAAVEAGRSAGDAAFPWGAMSAAVRAERATLWTRTEAPAEVRAHIAAGPQCETRTSAWHATRRDDGLVAHLELDGLRPGTRYRYTLELRGSDLVSSPGFFRTAPLADSPVRLAIGADLSSRASMHGLIDELATSGAELLLWLGDWPYADSGRAARTLDEFREKHLETRRALPVQQLMRAMPVHAVWDDHEVTNDWDARTAVDHPERVAHGKAVWREFFALRDAPAGEIYRHYRFGPGLEIFHLDLRSHRDANTADDTLAKTMLGAAQRDWLLETLSTSEATFKLVLLSVPLDWGTTGKDHWAGFVHERDAILEHIVAQGIEGVVLLSGDQHWLAVHHLPQGLKVFQTGALAQTPRRPRDRVPPQVRLQHKALSFGLLDYAPGPPATLTFTGFGNRTESRNDTGDPEILYQETLQAGAGRIYIEPPRPGLDWQLEGAHTFVGHGSAELPLAPPGAYTLSWRALVPGLPAPPPQDFTLRAGGKMTLAPEALPDDAVTGLVFFETFDDSDETALAARWLPHEHCAPEQPGAAWRLDAGELHESGNCYDADDEPSDLRAARRYRARDKHLRTIAPQKRGAHLQADSVTFGDGWLGMRVAPHDNDAFGLMYAIQDGAGESYYRVSFDAQRGYARLVRVVDGQFTVLAEDRHLELPLRQWLRLVVERDGPRHTVHLDDQLVLEAEDDALGPGAIALYSWGMDDVRFDEVFVRSFQ